MSNTIDGGELDDLLREILTAAGLSVASWHEQRQWRLGDMRAAVRTIYEMGYAAGYAAATPPVKAHQLPPAV